jgi:hypothetical protein
MRKDPTPANPVGLLIVNGLLSASSYSTDSTAAGPRTNFLNWLHRSAAPISKIAD